MALSEAGRGGAALFIGALQFIMAIVLAEIYYPGYNVSTNTISDLGSNSYLSAIIANSSVVLLGILVVVGAFFIHRHFRWWPFTAMLVLAGVGAAGVGIFTETYGLAHGFMELLAFLFGGLAAVNSFRLQRSPMSYFSLVLGAITLVALVLFLGSEYIGLGEGGMERMIAYPVLLWGVGFGGHLMGMERIG